MRNFGLRIPDFGWDRGEAVRKERRRPTQSVWLFTTARPRVSIQDPDSEARIRKARQAGFTLAEVLAAMLIMAVVIPVVVEGALLANRVGVVAERERTAAILADAVLTEAVVTEGWRDGARSGDFGPAHPGFEWRIYDEAWDVDSLRRITVEVVFEVQGRLYTTQLTTLAPEEESDAASQPEPEQSP